MRVLIISAVFPPEPVVSASISFDLARELAKDNEVTVICPRPTRPLGYHMKEELTHNLRFRKIEMNSYTCAESQVLGRFRESISFGKHCANYIKSNQENFDIIYFNAWPLFSQFIISFTSKRLRIPYVVHVQDIYPESILNPARLITRVPYLCLLQLDRYVLKNAKAVVTISGHMCRYVKKTRKLSREIQVAYNWQDHQLQAHSPIQSNANPKFTFMFLGSISPAAGIDILIRGFYEAKIAGAQLVLAGAGSDKERLVKLASAYSGCDIKFIDAPKEQVPVLQQSADVLLLSLKAGSAGFALPSKLTSYLFSEKPVIACVDEDSAVGEILTMAGCGWVCEPNSVKKVASTFLFAVNVDNDTRSEMGKKGRVFAEHNLSKLVNLSILKKIIVSG
ncbi:MAG: glycosyltransferase family 4 protein [Ferruginibacter sp.]